VKCRDCKYWVQNDKTCHKNPPVSMASNCSMTYATTVFPVTKGGDRCGMGETGTPEE